MITRASSTRSRSMRIASTPSSFGMTRSIRTTPGRSCSASATASSPSDASPTISIPSCSSRKLRRPSRRTAWSSAISTRIASDIEVHRRSFPSRRPHLEASSDPLRALLHRRQAQSPRADVGRLRIEADPVVDDVELQPAVVAAETDDDTARLRMAERVLHRLLRNPEDLRVACRVGRKLEVALHLHLRGLHAPKHVDVLAQRATQAVLHEVRRPKLEDQRPELVERLACDSLELRDLRARGVRVAVEERGGGLGGEDDAVELLTDDVVELEREAVPLGDHRQLAALLVQARVRDRDRRVRREQLDQLLGGLA